MIKFNLTCITYLLLFASFAEAKVIPREFRLDEASSSPDDRLKSNSIIDIVPGEGAIWFGTGQGLTQLDLGDGRWQHIGTEQGLGKGGVSALVVTDSVLWAASAYSVKIQGDYLPAGGGLGYSYDRGLSWIWESQPVDSVDEEDYHPTTTNIQNVTYDIILSASAVWITSWGGGLRKRNYGETAWEVVTPDGLPFWPVNHYSHLAFSGVFANQTIFIGTAEGIFRSANEGRDWDQQASHTGALSITGNFITAMAAQKIADGLEIIWAATWKAEGMYEYYGISVSYDNGASWRPALSDSTTLPNGNTLAEEYGLLKTHNFGFRGDAVFAAADAGMWISPDRGRTWGNVPLQNIYDPQLNEKLEGIDFFSVAGVGDSTWIGTDEGVAVGWYDAPSGEYTYRIHRAHISPGGDEPDTYAYPNPFSPRRGQITRFQIYADEPSIASLGIWDFGMNPVFKVENISITGAGARDMEGYAAISWNGKTSQGNIAANGVYYYRINIAGRTYWGKIMVLD